MPKINVVAPAAVAAPEPSNITVSVNPPEDPNLIRIEVVDPNVEKVIFNVQARRALNGDIMIFDHKDIDICRKIVSLNRHMCQNVHLYPFRSDEMLRA